MPGPQIVAVASGSPAARAGLRPGDEVAMIGGEEPRDVIRWQMLVDGPEVPLVVRRGGEQFSVMVAKGDGERFGADVDAAVFDGVQTCDNHCEFCFVHQLPRGMRRSLYLKDDDYRLSFLYGNFTTLTRFTELDYERVVTERLSPLYVSIHSTDPDVRAAILQNRRGAVSLRWLRLLLDAGIEVHGQVVVCPGVNDGDMLADTLVGVLDRFPELRTLCVVPLGVSRHNRQPRMRPHTRAEAEAVLDLVHDWQEVFMSTLDRRLAFAADEYYLMCGREFPAAEHYEGFDMHEDGIGMARAFKSEFHESTDHGSAPRAGFFAWVDGAPADGYRAPRQAGLPAWTPPESWGAPADGYGVPRQVGDQGGRIGRDGGAPADGYGVPRQVGDQGGRIGRDGGAPADGRRPPPQALPAAREPLPAAGSCCHGRGHDGGAASVAVGLRPRRAAPAAVLTGTLGAAVVAPLVRSLGRADVRVVPVRNRFFGGNIGVTGLMVGEDLARTLAAEPEGHRYLLPDVCLSRGRFLDGMTPADLPRPVEVVATHGRALRQSLQQ